MNQPGCLVCKSTAVDPLLCDRRGRRYHRCGTCHARFLEAAFHLPAQAEMAHYLTHENQVDDLGYRAFLARLADPLLAQLPPGARGLDYGCGPGPALAAMLREAGHDVAVYDPFFAPDADVLAQRYDFVTCTEVAEHFHDPATEFARLAGMLRPGGILAVMTTFQTDDALFEAWRYRLDPTHVVFYRPETFAWLAGKLDLACEIIRKDVVFMTSAAP